MNNHCQVHFEMFLSTPSTFQLNNSSFFVLFLMWMLHILKYTTIMVLNYSFTQHTTAFSQ